MKIVRFRGLLVVLGSLFGASISQAADARTLAATIDKHMGERWQAEQVIPTPIADDATFARRVYLDLVGRIPTVAEIRRFLESSAPDKRQELITQLMTSGAYARRVALFWRREWLPQTDTPPFAALAVDTDQWLTTQFREGVPYDTIARSLLTASRDQRTRGQAPATLFAVSEFKPENIAANATRAFLGVNLDCAQCHDHPFARWTRDQFWETAAFFVRPNAEQPTESRLTLAIPNTKRIVRPRFLNDEEPAWPIRFNEYSGRDLFAQWVTTKDGDYFARNAVNRLWAGYLGTGFVEPLDDLSGENPAVHPELFAALTKAFVRSGYNLRTLTTGILLSQTYQRSVGENPSSVDPRWYSAASVRGLTGEQLYDSLRVAAGLPVERDDLDPANALRERNQFTAKFRLDRPSQAQRSILQSLSLLNGKQMAEWTSPTTPTLRAIADAPFLSTDDRIETLFLATLSRKPTKAEREFLAPHLARTTGSDHEKRALADLFWALLNSSEFHTNH